MKKTLKKVIAVAGAVAMLGSTVALTACGKGKVYKPEFDVETYETESQKLYDENLGEFKEYYEKALAATNVSERYALMAIAEAKMLESGVFMPSTTQGGRYAISKAVAHSGTPVLWGNDSDRLHYVVAANKLVKAEDRKELNAKWAAAADADTYLTQAKAYMTEKGYTLKTEYKTSFTQDPRTWDILATSEQPTSQAIVQTYDGLVEYDVKGVLKPAMAEAVPTGVKTADGTYKFTFKIRDGQKWVTQSGEDYADFTAQDFATGFQHMLDAKAGLEWLVDGTIVGVHEYLADPNKDFSKVGVTVDAAANTVTYEVADYAESYFLTMLSYSIFAPVNKAFFESQGGVLGKDFNAAADSYNYGKAANNIAYCGPYLVSEFTSKNKIVYTKNNKWWNSADANARTCDTITMTYAAEMKAKDIYDEVVKDNGNLDGCSLTNATIGNAKADNYGSDNLFNTYSYLTSTTATTFNGFLNINRYAFANDNDSSKMVSPQQKKDAERTKAAMQNQNFRLAFLMGFDRIGYNAILVGEELAPNSLRNSYTPGNFVQLQEATTVKINGTDKTYSAGTNYGEIMQDQLKADGVPITVWKENNAGEMSSDGFDGWYNAENAKSYLQKALAELEAAGVKVDNKKNKIQIDYPYTTSMDEYVSRAEAVKQNLETSLDGYVQVNLIAGDDEAWQEAGFNPQVGYAMNYDFCDLSGWGPDYGDPSSYLDTMLGQANTMTKYIGLF